MLELVNLKVTPYIEGISKSNTYLRVQWETGQTDEDLDSIEITVYRSNSPDGEFIQVSQPLFNIFDYIDRDVNLFSKHRKFWYKVRARNVTTDRTVEIGPAILEAVPDLIGLEEIRRNNLVLKRFTGSESAVFLRRTYGQHCGSCWDYAKSRKTRSNCRECFNTGFEYGFYSQVNAYVNFNPSAEDVQLLEPGKIQPENTVGWMSNFPLMSPEDVIVEVTNERWRVVRVKPTMKQRHVIRQILELAQIRKSDIEYDIPVSDPSAQTSELDRAFRREHTLVARPFDTERIKSRSVPIS
jgi:hypothetical protein